MGGVLVVCFEIDLFNLFFFKIFDDCLVIELIVEQLDVVMFIGLVIDQNDVFYVFEFYMYMFFSNYVGLEYDFFKRGID